MKVLLSITGLDRGGAEKNLVLLVKHLDRSRFEPVVVSLRPRGPYAEAVEAQGARVVSLGATGPRDLARLWRASDLARSEGAAVVHGWMFHGNMWARLAARRAGVPCLSSLRVAEGELSWHVALDRWTRGLVDLYTANSDALARFAVERHGVPDDRIVVVPNACEIVPPSRPRAEVRADLGIDAAAPVAVTVGRLHAQKDPFLLLEAAARVVARRPDARFLLVGDGPLRADVERAAAALGGAARVLGERTDVADLLGAADLFLFASRWEGLPNAVIEAMGAGLPVVTTDFDGADEVVRPACGRIVPGRDATSLAGAVLDLLDDPLECRRLGRAGRRLVEALYAPAKAARSYEALYERLAGGATS